MTDDDSWCWWCCRGLAHPDHCDWCGPLKGKGCKMEFLPGDVFFTRTKGWLGGAIRWATRYRGEGQTLVNHTGIVVRGGGLFQVWPESPLAVEAQEYVRATSVEAIVRRPGTQMFAAFRYIGKGFDPQAAVMHAVRQIGQLYGFMKLPLHALDGLVGKLVGQDIYLFRRLGLSPYDICSYLVVNALKHGGLKLNGRHGLRVRQATPDDLWDYVLARSTQDEPDWAPVGAVSRKKDGSLLVEQAVPGRVGVSWVCVLPVERGKGVGS